MMRKFLISAAVAASALAVASPGRGAILSAAAGQCLWLSTTITARSAACRSGSTRSSARSSALDRRDRDHASAKRAACASEARDARAAGCAMPAATACNAASEHDAIERRIARLEQRVRARGPRRQPLRRPQRLLRQQRRLATATATAATTATKTIAAATTTKPSGGSHPGEA